MSSDDEIDLAPLKATCEALRAASGEDANWSWDQRFDAALCLLADGAPATVHAALGRAFPFSWRVDTIGTAPGVVQDIADAMGGAREGQELFVTDPEKPVVLVGAWWPWSNGTQVSLRVLLWTTVFGVDLSDEIRAWLIRPGT